MADRVDFYFRQRVTEAELDLACELLEQADRDLAADIGIYGIVMGAVPTQHSPVPDLTVDLTSPTRAYDRLGQRIFVGTDQTIDCSVDLVGIPTAVSGPANERWLAIFLRFDRQLSDPRTDGNAQQVYFRRDESFELVVRQAPEGPVGAAVRVAMQQDELLVCDLRLGHGQTQLLNAHIDLGRRQAFIFAEGDAVAVESGTWNVLQPLLGTVQSSLDEVDAELTDHFTGAARRHPASAIDFIPHAFVAAVTVQAALVELLDKLLATTAGDPGAKRVGADAVTGTPNALGPGTVDSQLSQLLAWLNAHVAAITGAHNASAIAALPHAHITSTNVQAQLQEIVADLESTLPSLGTAQVGSGAISGSPYTLANGTARSQLTSLLSSLNTHVGGADHYARYWPRTETVNNADTVDGQHASAFALAGHDHDGRYMRNTYLQSDVFAAGESKVMTTLADRPDLVTVSYNTLSSGVPQATTYIRGALTADIRAWVTKQSAGGDKDYQITVQNLSASELYINVAAYRVGT